ncbi:MAG: nucleotidyl transferase AbiEii/AbiGii toxin family protein [Pedobacter sp.]|jgi:predicted nucleotidyltransferase component of viral defense system
MIKQWIESYKPKNVQETEQALREIMQEITLAGLYRANFFKHAAFYGGTALRIFHGLNRFSEDLDFSLLEKNPDFELESYLNTVIDEFNALGIHVTFKQKLKLSTSNVDSAFLKSDTLWSELVFENTIPQIKLSTKPGIKIKVEVDTDPPINFETENQLLIKPFSFYVNCFTLPNLFAGKMHALLFRKWKNRVKGRDWYDLEWYIKKGVELNLNHLCQRALESGDWKENSLTKDQLIELLNAKINAINIENVKEDVIRFIQNPNDLEIWSQDYFKKLIMGLKVLTNC